MPDSNPGSQFHNIWKSALTKYKRDTDRDYFEGWLGEDSPDALFRLLDDELKSFKHFQEYRKKGEKVRRAIEPVLNMVNVFSETIGEGVAMAFSPAKAVSVAIRVLINGARDVSAHYDMIIEMFEKLKGFMGRLDVYIKQNITGKLKGLIVDILAQVLVVLGVATKWINQNRLCKGVALFTGECG
ncbi:hypothetical protein HETIRDRAFT_312718 [Heterobasidion irregulare TC 32-1]|uniref:Fungal STAND N-terminal Goodbye domain-containing protein n=1 Tax=Heterobasidion irregulare (strain TC 32-1) TaxID=747525 RepID=W4KE48_HETIT|nr:uncharacterized protein HETIRDRAFT_312718 [Heterobasidion irregulare TC 32-1]ETW83595.1 hypothetical protein HETIRDRAFT_312718 [Heterobasidion irregulare TC 32-1]